jgi:hypothetical protein
VLHCGEFFVAGPGDGEEEGGVGFGFDIVPDGVAESEQGAGGEIVRLAVNGDADLALEDMDGESSVGVMLFHVCGVLHGDENDAEVVLLEKSFGIDARWPRLLLFGVGHLFRKIELRDFVDHRAVLQRGCHVRSFIGR